MIASSTTSTMKRRMRSLLGDPAAIAITRPPIVARRAPRVRDLRVPVGADPIRTLEGVTDIRLWSGHEDVVMETRSGRPARAVVAPSCPVGAGRDQPVRHAAHRGARRQRAVPDRLVLARARAARPRPVRDGPGGAAVRPSCRSRTVGPDRARHDHRRRRVDRWRDRRSSGCSRRDRWPTRWTPTRARSGLGSRTDPRRRPRPRSATSCPRTPSSTSCARSSTSS